jgi:hypothetical protein
MEGTWIRDVDVLIRSFQAKAWARALHFVGMIPQLYSGPVGRGAGGAKSHLNLKIDGRYSLICISRIPRMDATTTSWAKWSLTYCLIQTASSAPSILWTEQ